MAKLVVFRKELEWHDEHEIKDTSKFGMDVVIIHKGGEVDVRHNCTEVHHRYSFSVMGESTAFESDIHSTGGTLNVDRINVIIVSEAIKLHKNY